MKISVSAIGAGSLKSRGCSYHDVLILLVPLVAIYLAFPTYLSLANYVMIMALFALSLDIALGIAGIVTLGHAVFFGVGAYAAGLISIAGWHEPISTVLVAGVFGALVALLIGPLILRLTGLPLIMATLTICVFFWEAANKMGWLTGGDDGLLGITFDPILGIFDWTIYGTTEFIYVSVWLLLIFLALKQLVSSPFGIALRGIRENRLRMHLLGSPVLRHLVVAYTISGFIAGVAGALLAQITKFVGLEVLSIETSIDGLVMLVLGGVGHLYGALLGTPLYLLAKDLSKQWNPHAWMIVIGCLLVLTTLFARGGVFGALYRVGRHISHYVGRKPH